MDACRCGRFLLNGREKWRPTVGGGWGGSAGSFCWTILFSTNTIINDAFKSILCCFGPPDTLGMAPRSVAPERRPHSNSLNYKLCIALDSSSKPLRTVFRALLLFYYLKKNKKPKKKRFRNVLATSLSFRIESVCVCKWAPAPMGDSISYANEATLVPSRKPRGGLATSCPFWRVARMQMRRKGRDRLGPITDELPTAARIAIDRPLLIPSCRLRGPLGVCNDSEPFHWSAAWCGC